VKKEKKRERERERREERRERREERRKKKKKKKKRGGWGDVALIRPLAHHQATPPPPQAPFTCVLRALQSDMDVGCVCAAAQSGLAQYRTILSL